MRVPAAPSGVRRSSYIPAAAYGLIGTLWLAPPARSQELTGTIRFPDGLTPAPGVVLEATRPADARLIARAISGADGSFVLRLDAGDFRLRALRIGYRPTDLGRHTLAPGERRRTDFVLGDRPVVLAAVTTRAASRCERLAAADAGTTRAGLRSAGEAVATLFEEARKALVASQLTPPEGRPTARILLEQSVMEPDGRPRVRPVRSIAAGFAARPFRSAPPAQLAALGYAIEERDGTTYFAPDANVLLSDQFAAQHCLRLASSDPERPGRVGIDFRPVGSAGGAVRIKGTIWLDSASFALERLDFNYVGLPGGLDGAGLGGSIEFAQLPDGLWFEDRWEIRMPRLTIRHGASVGVASVDGSSGALRLDAIQVAGGRVLSIARADRVLYASAGREAELLTPDDPRSLETALMLVRAACPAADAEDSELRSTVVGLVLERDEAPVAGARVTTTWQEGFRISAGDDITWRERTVFQTSESDGFFALCGLPRERRIPLQAILPARRTPRTLVRFEADAEHTRADLRFVSPP